MDPLTVAGATFGLLNVGAALASKLTAIVNSARDVPTSVNGLLTEMTSVSAAIQALQSYVCGSMSASAERGALILVEHLLTTLTGCVAAYSDLTAVVDEVMPATDSEGWGLFDRLKWVKEEAKIGVIVQRLQHHKNSLTLMLTILQCQSMQEAQKATNRLVAVIETVLNNNEDLSRRIRELEHEGSVLAKTADSQDAQNVRVKSIRASARVSFVEPDRAALNFTYDLDLQASRVYNRAAKDVNRWSGASVASTAHDATALSVFSSLRISQVSNLSFYALPTYSEDLRNSRCYVFGEAGARKSIEAANRISRWPESTSSALVSAPAPLALVKSRPSIFRRFARRQKSRAAVAHPKHAGMDLKLETIFGLSRSKADWEKRTHASDKSDLGDTEKLIH